MPDFTFITSFFRDGGHLGKNIQTVGRFNQNTEYKWILIDNSSGGDDLTELLDDKFTVYKGLNESYVQPLFLKRVSISNAMSLNFGVSKSNTRFICVIDPDFFVIYPNWIDAVMEYMDYSGVGILSAPYHPRWYEKAHRATGHFMVIDTNFVPCPLLDFAPSLRDYDPNNKELPKWVGKRRNLRRFNDCGGQIEKRFASEIEYLTPLVSPDPDARISATDRILDSFLPKRWRLTNIDYPVVSARSKGLLPKIESYYWRGYPFALHLRRYGFVLSGGDVKTIDSEINELLDRVFFGYKNLLEAR